MLGEELRVGLGNGHFLYGFACPEHGLLYVMQGQPGDLVTAEGLQPLHGAPELHNGDVCACYLCEQALGCNVSFPGAWSRAVEVSEGAYEQLQEVAKGAHDES